MSSGADAAGAFAGNLHQLLPHQTTQNGAFNPSTSIGSGASCSDAFGAGYIDCNGVYGVCYNPNINETCCPGNGDAYPCPSQSFCLDADGLCCPDGLDAASCAASNNVVSSSIDHSTSNVTPQSTSTQRGPVDPSSSTPNVLDSTSPTTIPATSTDVPPQPVGGGLSTGSKAGIGVGVAVAVIIASSLLYLCYKRRRRARLNLAINDDSAVDHFESETMQPHMAELKGGAKLLDPPPAYPYDKVASRPYTGSIPGSTSGIPINSRHEDQSQLPNMESSEISIAGFYAQASKDEISNQSQHDPIISSFHKRPEIDGNPIYEAPDSPKRPERSSTNDVT
ncbi:MAG: hypothetical protein Q9208_006121 [Pyrenodesmia sp. 3 TL-2023]